MPDTPMLNEILRQLSDIQREVGSTSSTLNAVKEDLEMHVSITTTFHKEVKEGMESLLKRTQTLEDGYSNNRQRTIGFLAAWSVIAAGFGGIVWLLSSGWDSIAKILAKMFS